MAHAPDDDSVTVLTCNSPSTVVNNKPLSSIPIKSIISSPESKFSRTGESRPTLLATTVKRSSLNSDSTPSPDMVTLKSVPPRVDRFPGIMNLASS